MKSIIIFITFIGLSNLIFAVIPTVAKSVSPNGKIHAVMDVDRDPKISPEWKENSFPQIEITEKLTGKILVSIEYFGAVGDDNRPLREHIEVSWRSDSKAFAVTINDRFYSSSMVFVQNKKDKFVSVDLPTSYEKMTGFPEPDIKHLRPRGRGSVVGWDTNGQLIYSIFMTPLPSFVGKDPLRHRVFLKVTSTEMIAIRVENEKGKWRNGNWVKDNTELDAKVPAK